MEKTKREGSTMRPYIGCKLVTAEPQARGGKEGYRVKYAGGYESWCPADVFEKHYLPLANKTKITSLEVESFCLPEKVWRDGNHTILKLGARNGMDFIESAACVDPANYDEGIGRAIATKKADEKIWFGLGFVLAWAKNGLRKLG